MHPRTSLTLARCVALLVGAVALLFPLVAWLAHQRYGQPGVAAAAIAAFVCTIASALALATVALAHGPQRGLYALLGGMLFRMGLPLGAGIYLSQRGGWLASSGVFGCIVVFYLWTLVIETTLSLRLLKSAAGKS